MKQQTELFWIVDFDGTLINLDLGARFSEWIIAFRKVGVLVLLIRIFAAPVNLLLRKLEVRQVIRAWSAGLSKNEIDNLAEEFLDYIKPEIIINESVLKYLRMDLVSKKILLTGCPQELVIAFLGRYKISDFHDVIGMTTALGVVITRHPYGRSKAKLARRCNPYAAIGDSWQDRFVLRGAVRAIVVPRVEKLEKLGRRSGWEIVDCGN
jgi:phosphoserine phosphatase